MLMASAMKEVKLLEDFILFICFIMVVVQTSICINEYFSYKTVPSVEKKLLKDSEFPSIYICGKLKENGNPPYLEGEEIDVNGMALGTLSSSKGVLFEDTIQFIGWSNLTNMTSKEYLNKILFLS